MKKIYGAINQIETFGAVDGPGVRYVVFLQGCKMRCKYCHNPETWQLVDADKLDEKFINGKCTIKDGEVVLADSETNELNIFTVHTAEDLLKHAIRYKTYWKNGGGITVSGGEPLLQIDFVTELFKQAKQLGINTTIDTCGQPFAKDKEFMEKFEELCKYTDLFMVDIKHIDSTSHKDLTGFENENILEMIKYLDEAGKDMWIRHVIVPGITDDKSELTELGKFISGLKNIKKIETLPYHSMARNKYEKLGIKYRFDNLPDASSEEAANALKIIENK